MTQVTEVGPTLCFLSYSVQYILVCCRILDSGLKRRSGLLLHQIRCIIPTMFMFMHVLITKMYSAFPPWPRLGKRGGLFPMLGGGLAGQVTMLKQKMLCPCLLCAASVFSLHCLPYLTLLETMILRLVNWCVILALFYVWNEMDQNTKLSLDHYYFNALIRFSKQLPAQLWQWISMFWFCHIRTRNTFLVFDVLSDR